MLCDITKGERRAFMFKRKVLYVLALAGLALTVPEVSVSAQETVNDDVVVGYNTGGRRGCQSGGGRIWGCRGVCLSSFLCTGDDGHGRIISQQARC